MTVVHAYVHMLMENDTGGHIFKRCLLPDRQDGNKTDQGRRELFNCLKMILNVSLVAIKQMVFSLLLNASRLLADMFLFFQISSLGKFSALWSRLEELLFSWTFQVCLSQAQFSVYQIPLLKQLFSTVTRRFWLKLLQKYIENNLCS